MTLMDHFRKEQLQIGGASVCASTLQSQREEVHTERRLGTAV